MVYLYFWSTILLLFIHLGFGLRIFQLDSLYHYENDRGVNIPVPLF